MKSFNYLGVWWLPSQGEQKFPGEITFLENEQATLILGGTFSHNQPGPIEFSNYPIIWGTTEDGQPITLLHCQEVGFKLAEEQEEKYLVDVVFIGVYVADQEQIRFATVDVHYTYLAQWAGVFPYRGLQQPFAEVKALTTKGIITVQPLIDVWQRLLKQTDVIGEAKLPELVRIRCEVQEALSLDEWTTRYIAPIQHFISLATQRPNALFHLVGYLLQESAENVAGNNLGVPVQIAFSPAIVPIQAGRSTTPKSILFTLQETAPNFSSIIDIWLSMADELNSAFRLFFGVLYTNLPLDLQFLLLAQAAEVYQDFRFDKTPLTEEEFQNVVTVLQAACPDPQKEWLENVLRYSNGATFSQQVKNLITNTYIILDPLLGKNSAKRGDFSRIVYNTRNYLTHHSKELALNAANGIELLFIIRCLSVILQVCFMRDIGFTDQQITQIFHKKHESYRLALFLQQQVHLEKLISHS